MPTFALEKNTVIYDSAQYGSEGVGYYPGGGAGSIYTIQATGTEGQTATVSGRNADDMPWQSIVSLTVSSTLTDSAVVQFTWAQIKHEGSARLVISRGAA